MNKMKCKQCRENFAEYIHGVLDQLVETEIREHLDTCQDCYQEYQFVKSYLNEARLIPGVNAPEGLLQDIRKKIEKPPSIWQSILKPIPQIALKSACVLVVLWLALSVIHPTDLTQPMKTAEEEQELRLVKESPPMESVKKEKSANQVSVPQSRKPAITTPNNEVDNLAAVPVESAEKPVITIILSPVTYSANTNNTEDNTEKSKSSLFFRKALKKETSDLKEPEMKVDQELSVSEPTSLKDESNSDLAKNMIEAKAGEIIEIIKGLGGLVIPLETANTENDIEYEVMLPLNNFTVFEAKLRDLGETLINGDIRGSNEGTFIKFRILLKMNQ